jgi:hypothetical protein
MTTALPAATTAVASTATQGDVKNWITGVHDYLAGLLGTDGTTATAKTTLGVVSGVSSFNTRTGAISLTSGDVTGALGYTPPTSAVPLNVGIGVGCFFSISDNGTVATAAQNYSAGQSYAISGMGTCYCSRVCSIGNPNPWLYSFQRIA